MEPIHSFSTLSVLLTSIIIATTYAEKLQIRQYGCMVNHDCPIDEPICEHNICVNGTLPLGCGSTDQCPKGEVCGLHGICVSAPCMVNHDCPRGTICENNVCVLGTQQGCQTSEDCPKREKCANNICVRNRTRAIPPYPICRRGFDDCPKGEVCKLSSSSNGRVGTCVPQKPEVGLGCMVNHDCPGSEPICSDENICVPGVVPNPCNTTYDCPQMETCGRGSRMGKFCARYHSGIPPMINCTVNHDCPPFTPDWGCNKEKGICQLGQQQLGCMTTDDCARDHICSEQKICVLAPGPEPYWCQINADCPPITPYCDMQQWFCV